MNAFEKETIVKTATATDASMSLVTKNAKRSLDKSREKILRHSPLLSPKIKWAKKKLIKKGATAKKATVSKIIANASNLELFVVLSADALVAKTLSRSAKAKNLHLQTDN